MGVETRHPFSDRRVIEFFLSLPLEMKTYSPLPKRVIRAGMEGILPEMVRCRTFLAHPGQAFQSSLLNLTPGTPGTGDFSRRPWVRFDGMLI